MTRFKKMFATAIISALSLVGAVVATEAPAFATDPYGGTCAQQALCLYEEISEDSPTADRWQSSFTNIANHPVSPVGPSGGCLNLGSAAWSDGKLVDNSSASLMWYVQSAAWAGWKLSFYNWVNCNLSGPYINGTAFAPPQAPHIVSNLGSFIYPYNNPTSTNEWHTISSISITEF